MQRKRSALVHLEADAEMQKYEIEQDADSDKVSRRSLNLVQRKTTAPLTKIRSLT